MLLFTQGPPLCNCAPLSFPGASELSFHHRHRSARSQGGASYLPEAGVDGADEHAERLASAAAHGAEHLAQEGDEAQPALHVLLL